MRLTKLMCVQQGNLIMFHYFHQLCEISMSFNLPLVFFSVIVVVFIPAKFWLLKIFTVNFRPTWSVSIPWLICVFFPPSLMDSINPNDRFTFEGIALSRSVRFHVILHLYLLRLCLVSIWFPGFVCTNSNWSLSISKTIVFRDYSSLISLLSAG